MQSRKENKHIKSRTKRVENGIEKPKKSSSARRPLQDKSNISRNDNGSAMKSKKYADTLNKIESHSSIDSEVNSVIKCLAIDRENKENESRNSVDKTFRGGRIQSPRQRVRSKVFHSETDLNGFKLKQPIIKLEKLRETVGDNERSSISSESDVDQKHSAKPIKRIACVHLEHLSLNAEMINGAKYDNAGISELEHFGSADSEVAKNRTQSHCSKTLTSESNIKESHTSELVSSKNNSAIPKIPHIVLNRLKTTEPAKIVVKGGYKGDCATINSEALNKVPYVLIEPLSKSIMKRYAHVVPVYRNVPDTVDKESSPLNLYEFISNTPEEQKVKHPTKRKIKRARRPKNPLQALNKQLRKLAIENNKLPKGNHTKTEISFKPVNAVDTSYLETKFSVQNDKNDNTVLSDQDIFKPDSPYKPIDPVTNRKPNQIVKNYDAELSDEDIFRSDSPYEIEHQDTNVNALFPITSSTDISDKYSEQYSNGLTPIRLIQQSSVSSPASVHPSQNIIVADILVHRANDAATPPGLLQQALDKKPTDENEESSLANKTPIGPSSNIHIISDILIHSATEHNISKNNKASLEENNSSKQSDKPNQNVEEDFVDWLDGLVSKENIKENKTVINSPEMKSVKGNSLGIVCDSSPWRWSVSPRRSYAQNRNINFSGQRPHQEPLKIVEGIHTTKTTSDSTNIELGHNTVQTTITSFYGDKSRTPEKLTKRGGLFEDITSKVINTPLIRVLQDFNAQSTPLPSVNHQQNNSNVSNAISNKSTSSTDQTSLKANLSNYFGFDSEEDKELSVQVNQDENKENAFVKLMSTTKFKKKKKKIQQKHSTEKPSRVSLKQLHIALKEVKENTDVLNASFGQSGMDSVQLSVSEEDNELSVPVKQDKNQKNTFVKLVLTEKHEKKKKVQQKGSIEKPSRVSLKQLRMAIKAVKENIEVHNASFEQLDMDSEQLPSPCKEDTSMLLFKIEDLEVKRPRYSYERKRPKRKRLPSINGIPSDDEEVNRERPRKKKKNVRSKEEEEQAEKWAQSFNSMCEEVENYPLVIE